MQQAISGASAATHKLMESYWTERKDSRSCAFFDINKIVLNKLLSFRVT